MSSEQLPRDHINVIHPDTGKRYRLNIRGDVGRLSIGRLKNCLAQSRCTIPRTRMRLCLNGVFLAHEKDLCADVGVRSGATLTVEDADVREQHTSSPSATSSSSVPPSPTSSQGSPRHAAAAMLNSRPRRQLELQTLDAQESFLRHDRWRCEAAIHDTLNALDATLAESSAKKNALSRERERAERELALIEGQARQLREERERLSRLKDEEAGRAAAREEELAARRASLRREQDTIRAVAQQKLENEQRLAHIAHAREQYKIHQRRVQAEQAALDAQYRDRVLAITAKEVDMAQQQDAQRRQAEELAWERRVLETQRQAYLQQGQSPPQPHQPGVYGGDVMDAGSRGVSATPRPSQRPPTSHPYPIPTEDARGGHSPTQQSPFGMNHSHHQNHHNDRHDSNDRTTNRHGDGRGFEEEGAARAEPVAQSSPLHYRGATAGGPARRDASSGGLRTTASAAPADAVHPSHAQSHGPARRTPGEAHVAPASSGLPYTMERPSIRHQNDGLSVSRESASRGRPTTHLGPLQNSTGSARHTPQQTSPMSGSLHLRGSVGGPGGARDGRGGARFLDPHAVGDPRAPPPQPARGAQPRQPLDAATAANTSASTAGERLTNLSSGATSLGPPLHGTPSQAGAPAVWRGGPSAVGVASETTHGVSGESAAPLVVMADGGYYAPEENAAENLHRLGEALGFTGEDSLAFDRNNTCIVNLSDAYTLLVTYDASTERLYVYSTLLTAPSLQHDEKLRLGLYEMLLEGSLLGREVCGGGISASLKKDFILMSTSLFMPTSQPWSLRTLVPSFLQALQHWREQVAAFLTAHGAEVGGATADSVPIGTHAPLPTTVADLGSPEKAYRGISVLRHEGPRDAHTAIPTGEPHAQPQPQPLFRDVPVLGVDVTDTLVVNGIPTHYRDGVLVLQVAGPAALAGLRPHDFIEHIDGVAVDGTESFGRVVRALTPGAVANLRVVRGGLPMMVAVRVGAARVVADASANA